MSVSPEEFVRIWQAASSVKEVCEKTGMCRNTAQCREVRYRNAGIRLKGMGRRKLNNVALNAIIGETPCDTTSSTSPPKASTPTSDPST